jgi:hypothetical protein
LKTAQMSENIGKPGGRTVSLRSPSMVVTVPPKFKICCFDFI